jgi:voltage-gated potassium channel Kch
MGIRDLGDPGHKGTHAHEPKAILLLGFSRYASTLLEELSELEPGIVEDIGVVDFNPEVKTALDRRGVFNLYGDIGHSDVLKHANVAGAGLLVCTLPDSMLKGTTNVKLLRQISALAPDAKVIMTADFYYTASQLYDSGATFVFLPRLMSARELAVVVLAATTGQAEHMREEAMSALRVRDEVLP